MEEKVFKLLSYITSASSGKYRLFSKSELYGRYGDESVTEDDFNGIIDSLDISGFIDVKYSDKDLILLKPLGKSLTLLDKENKSVDNQVGSVSERGNFLRFFISFLGGFSGALVGIAVFAIIC